MSIDRAPKGTHAGGQFVSSPRSEPSISLTNDDSGPTDDNRAETGRQLSFFYEHIMDQSTLAVVEYGSLTRDEQARVRKMAKR